MAAKIRAIRSDPKHPFNDKRSGPPHEAAVREVAGLYRRLFPDEPEAGDSVDLMA